MLRTDSISLHVPEPLALIDATLLFTLQILVARHPDLLLPHEDAPPCPPPAVLAARELLGAIRELHLALENYRDTTRPRDPSSPR